MVNLRQYQKEAIETIKQTFKGYFRQYIEMPTGSGKTVTFLSYASQNHDRILIIVPSKQLLDQVYESALMFFHKSEVSRKGNRYEEDPKKVHICIIHSIRGDYLDFITAELFDLIIIDEAHHAQAHTYKRFLKLQSRSSDKDQKILGVTATPDRLDGELLKDILNTCSYKISLEDLIKLKFLSDVEGFSVKTKIDISDVKDNNRDFSTRELYKRLCKDDRNNIVIDLCKKEMMDRKTLIFCINIDHSKEINRLLNSSGISSSHIDGTMKQEERSSILNAFRNGDISILCNCQLLTEGFDEPSIDGIILARPTKSKSLFLQMVGRGLRISKGKKNCKIIDIVDNHKNLVGFNSLVTDAKVKTIEKFDSLNEICLHICEELIKVTESSIERTNLFNHKRIDDYQATDSMTQYLDDNRINYFQPIGFDEASFLIWFNELKKEYENGLN